MSADTAAVAEVDDGTASVEAGLDALESAGVRPGGPHRRLLGSLLPPVVAVMGLLVLWQALYSARIWPDWKLPGPAQVLSSVRASISAGDVWPAVVHSVGHAAMGFGASLVVGTPLGLLVGWTRPAGASGNPVRAALGPILSGLQSLPSVAWVPPAVIWLGLNNSMMYAVILLGAVPSIANGLVSGVDQVPPLFLRAGRTMGATGLKGIWHVTLPAALPGYVAGMKQGWAFSWRSLMAAEIIAQFPDLGVGLGQLLENGRTAGDMAMVFEAILLILFVGIAIDLLIFSPLERWVLRSRGLLVKS